MKTNLNEEQIEALWKRADVAGMPRRRFLIILAGSGAAAVLAACAPAVTTTPSPKPTTTLLPTPPSPTPTPSPKPTAPLPSPTATPPPTPIHKPIPSQFFVPLGSNAETRLEFMASRAYQTPNSFFFIRSHTWTPQPPVDVKQWNLSIEGDGINTPITLSYDDLLAMPMTTVTRYIECAGNGRSFFDSVMKRPAQGGQWHLGAYGIAEWTGVKLSDILNRAGVKSNAVGVMPAGFDSLNVRRPMPVDKAMQSDTLVAYMMNGDLLPPDHGFPARVITPGWIGVSNVKWVNKITVSTQPLFSDWNTKTYVLVGPDYQPQPPSDGPVVTSQVMKSACCLPWPATLKSGQQRIIGYAWSPNGKISKVDVSTDGGKTFQGATITGPNIELAGTRWEFTLNAQPGNLTITPRATDEKGNVQYDVSQQKWNQQGYLFGAMVPHPVTVSA